MTHRVRSAVGRLLALGVVSVVTLGVGASPLAAQLQTGKLEGTVTDQAGAPLANARVLLAGTSFGAVANDRGYYFINNVPVGTYNVRAQLIGYAPTEVRGVRVQGEQTVTADVRMPSSAVVVTGIVVSEAANPIVPRDQVEDPSISGGYRPCLLRTVPSASCPSSGCLVMPLPVRGPLEMRARTPPPRRPRGTSTPRS